jgi:ATP-dependent DNA helicase RecG
MRLRGQGDLFGERQSGLPAFRFADLERDLELLVHARTEARRLVEQDPTLAAHPELKVALERRYGERVRMYEMG